MSATCSSHERPIKSFASDSADGHVHAFAAEDLADQLASFHAGPNPACSGQAMHWVAAT